MVVDFRREFVGFLSVGGFLVEIPAISGVLVRRGILITILGNRAVFVFRVFRSVFLVICGV